MLKIILTIRKRGNGMEDRVIVLIPVYKPSEKFENFIVELRDKFKYVIIVNDGNDNKYKDLFESLEKEHGCILINHYTNLGKGRALKSGFNEALNLIANNPCIEGVITADADGQHLIEDIEKVKDALLADNNKLVLGSRKFKSKNIPLRSRFGNNVTKLVFRWLCGLKINDTQTGLRGIHKKYIEKCCSIEGERYEYETNMLLQMKDEGVSINEIEITTIYENNNSSSHFNPFLDSLKIYKTIIKYSLASLLSTLIEFVCFGILTNAGVTIFVATYIGRFISATVNFTMNRQLIFKSKGKIQIQIIKYVLLLIVSGSISAVCVYSINKLWTVHAIYIKMIVDTILYFFNYYMQNMFIFSRGERNGNN